MTFSAKGFHEFTYIYCMTMMSIAVFYAVYALLLVLRLSKFKWVQMMIAFCVVSNLTTIWFLVMEHYEKYPVQTNNPKEYCVITVFAVWSWYAMQNIIYWLFGFKYWVIAIEVPLMMSDEQLTVKEQKRFWTEKRYRFVSTFGIVVNVVWCLFPGVMRALCGYYSTVYGHVSEQMTKTLHIALYGQDALLLLSAIFLMDAIRRFSSLFKKDPRLQVNHQTMRLHVIALFIHTVFLIYF